MEIFDSKERIRKLFLEFEQVDNLHHSFMLELENSIYDKVNEYFEGVPFADDFPEVLKQYIISIINSTYAVIDKDKSYSTFRMQLELDNMANLNQKYSIEGKHLEFAEDIKMKTREVVTEFFPDLFELSGDGFRLLIANFEYNTKSFLMYFSNSFFDND